jgi:hypothetical protein
MRSAFYYPYFPYIDESLVKTALLLWDRLEFIVAKKGFKPKYDNPRIARAMELIGAPHCPSDGEKIETHTRIEELVERRIEFYVSNPSPPRHLEIWGYFPVSAHIPFSHLVDASRIRVCGI